MSLNVEFDTITVLAIKPKPMREAHCLCCARKFIDVEDSASYYGYCWACDRDYAETLMAMERRRKR